MGVLCISVHVRARVGMRTVMFWACVLAGVVLTYTCVYACCRLCSAHMYMSVHAYACTLGRLDLVPGRCRTTCPGIDLASAR